MTIQLSTFVTQLKNLIPDIPTEELSSLDLQQQIKQAVRLYSGDLPDYTTVDVSGDGGRYYAITTALTSWDDNFSWIEAIEYPAYAISDDNQPVTLEAEDWDDNYRDGSNVRYLYLPNHSPAAAETMRIKYTTPYTWTAGSVTEAVSQTGHGFSLNDTVYQDTDGTWGEDSSGLLATHSVSAVGTVDTFTAAELASNIPPAHFFAVCHKAACLTCQSISAKYSRASDSTIGSDSVNHPTRAEQFASRAREFCRMYAEALGLGGKDGEKTAPGVAEFVDWDTTPGWPGSRRFIFHGSDWR